MSFERHANRPPSPIEGETNCAAQNSHLDPIGTVLRSCGIEVVILQIAAHFWGTYQAKCISTTEVSKKTSTFSALAANDLFNNFQLPCHKSSITQLIAVPNGHKYANFRRVREVRFRPRSNLIRKIGKSPIRNSKSKYNSFIPKIVFISRLLYYYIVISIY